MIRVQCPVCGEQSEAPEEYVGREITCLACRQPFKIDGKPIKRAATPLPTNLVECPDCKTPVSKLAQLCPQCGSPGPLKRKASSVAAACALFGCLLPMVLMGGCFVYAVMTTEIPPWDQQDNSSMALIQAQGFVRKQLKSPSTAEFPGAILDGALGHVKLGPNQMYFVESYVDSQNGFGAMVRSKYGAILQQTGEHEWKLVKLAIE